MLRSEPGYDGSELFVRSVPIHGTERSVDTAMRAPPDTFQRKYGASQPSTIDDVYFLCGTRFALLCERCGHDAPGTVDFAKVGFSAWKGFPDPRLEAMDDYKTLVQKIGKDVSARLQHYCVAGKSVRQMAKIYHRTVREMTAKLDSDLGRLAVYFGYVVRR